MVLSWFSIYRILSECLHIQSPTVCNLLELAFFMQHNLEIGSGGCVVMHSLLLSRVPWCGCTAVCLSVEGRVNCFQLMAITHPGAVNIGVQALV